MTLEFNTDWENKQQGEEVLELELTDLRPNPYQPRKIFQQEALEELANSIRETGVFQPIIVRQSAIKGYDIIAGERRYRASKLANKKTIPAIVRTMDDAMMMQIAILENLQRENLTPIEEAQSYQTLMQRLNLTQQELAMKLGKSRPYIANYLRLLNLPKSIQNQLNNEELSFGHARALLAVDSKQKQEEIAQKIQKNNWSVRETENHINKVKQRTYPKKEKQIIYQEIERQLEEKFGTIVNVVGEKKGKIEFTFLSPEDLTNLLDKWDITID